jgi:hypothetical protein
MKLTSNAAARLKATAGELQRSSELPARCARSTDGECWRIVDAGS